MRRAQLIKGRCHRAMDPVVVVIAGGLFALSVASGRPAIRLTIVAAITAPVGALAGRVHRPGMAVGPLPDRRRLSCLAHVRRTQDRARPTRPTQGPGTDPVSYTHLTLPTK